MANDPYPPPFTTPRWAPNDVKVYQRNAPERDPRSPYAPYGQGPGGEVAEARMAAELAAEELRRMADEPRLVATVVEIRRANDRGTVGTTGTPAPSRLGHMLVTLGPGNAVDIHELDGARVGDRVLLNRNTMQATEIIRDDVATGEIITVERVDDERKLIEATLRGSLHVFRSPAFDVAKGERVVIDASATFVIGTLGMPPATFGFEQPVDVGWDQIGGQDEAKEALREAIEMPYAHPELFASYNKKPVKGVLMSGPPGTGKTLLGKASATALARAHGKTKSSGFVYVKGPELLDPLIGKSEAAVRALFASAKTFKQQHGYPAVIFIDECDALLGSRDRGQTTGISATVVPQFLAEMDGLEDSAAIFILATNRPDMLDAAVVREGRVDRKVRVDRPTREDAIRIFEIHLKGRPLLASHDPEEGPAQELARIGVAGVFADDRIITAYPDAVRVRDFVSGAMIANVVERASTRAMQRDIATGDKVASGITTDDLAWAIGQTQRELAEVNGSSRI